MVSHTWNLCSAFNLSKCIHTAVRSEQTHTHTLNTHPEQWAADAAVPGEQLGFLCLARGSHLSRGFEGGENTVYSLSPPAIANYFPKKAPKPYLVSENRQYCRASARSWSVLSFCSACARTSLSLSASAQFLFSARQTRAELNSVKHR